MRMTDSHQAEAYLKTHYTRQGCLLLIEKLVCRSVTVKLSLTYFPNYVLFSCEFCTLTQTGEADSHNSHIQNK